MGINGAAFIAGIYEHPDRNIPGKSLAQVHAELALGALADAGLSISDVDGYFANSAPGNLGILSMSEYLRIKPRHIDGTQTGGSSPGDARSPSLPWRVFLARRSNRAV
jgi:acetyl-CoA C-acetyltransferase